MPERPFWLLLSDESCREAGRGHLTEDAAQIPDPPDWSEVYKTPAEADLDDEGARLA